MTTRAQHQNIIHNFCLEIVGRYVYENAGAHMGEGDVCMSCLWKIIMLSEQKTKTLT